MKCIWEGLQASCRVAVTRAILNLIYCVGWNRVQQTGCVLNCEGLLLLVGLSVCLSTYLQKYFNLYQKPSGFIFCMLGVFLTLVPYNITEV